MSDYHPLSGLMQAEATSLIRSLQSRRLFSQEESEAIVHALIDIAESVEKIYLGMIPSLLSDSISTDAVFKDKLWDIREEFRHIEYHVKDGKLTEL